jgi:HEPN domain-containing protein
MLEIIDDSIMSNKIEIKFPRLPESTDHLFQSSNDWQNNACLNYMSDSWELFISGYKKAADLIVNQVKKTKSHRDLLVYPIVFLYRQYLELRLKYLIKEGSKLIGSYDDFPKTHKLDKLWKKTRKILDEAFPEDSEESKEQLDIIENLIKQFVSIDPDSFAFRYPTNKKGNTSLPRIKHINLRNLSEVMSRIETILDGASSSITEYLSYKIDM